MTDALNKAHSEASKQIAKVIADSKAAPKNAPGITKRTSAYYVDPTRVIEQPGFNSRFDMGEIEELAKSIKARKAEDGHGLLNDLRLLRIPADQRATLNADFWSLGGHRRMAAIRLLMKQGEVFEFGLPAKIESADLSLRDQLIIKHEDNAHKPLLPMEEAMDYKQMQEAGFSIKEICEVVSRKHVHVVATLALLQADDSVQQAVKEGSVGGTVAKKIATAARGDKAKQKELLAQAKAVGKDKAKKAQLDRSLNDTRRAKAESKGKTIKMRALSDTELSAIGSSLAESLAAKLRDCGFPLDCDVRGWVAKDDKLALAFTFGALEALKAAAGMIVNLDV